MSNISINVSRGADGELTTSDTPATPVNTEEGHAPAGIGFNTRANSPTHKVVIGPDMSQFEQSSHVTESFNMADSNASAIEANPHSILATLTKASGSPRIGGNVEESDRVTVDGMNLEVKQALKLGFLTRDQFGNVVDNLSHAQASALAAAETSEVGDSDEPVEVLSDDTLSFMQTATQGFSEVAAGQHMVNALTGELNAEGFARELEAGGHDVASAQEHLDAAAVGVATDILDQLGFDVEDEDATWETWSMLFEGLKAQNKGAYMDGIRQLVVTGNAEPLVKALGKYHRTYGALSDEPEGVTTKVSSSGEKLYDVGGVFVTAATARRMGLL